jgi:hypothetical protein
MLHNKFRITYKGKAEFLLLVSCYLGVKIEDWQNLFGGNRIFHRVGVTQNFN